jgi:hypothetical protein
MAPIAAILILTVAIQTGNLQSERVTSPAVEENIHEIMNGLSPDSLLYRALLRGSRGGGVRYPWMDAMKREGIKRVIVMIEITFDQRGRPKLMSVSGTHYFSKYDGDEQISDSGQLKSIRASGLEKQLDDLALQRTAKGFWLDVPRPRPHPFVGGAQVEFLDDEWLPTPNAPMFYASSGGKQSPGAGH